jgi:hypothetical protein
MEIHRVMTVELDVEAAVKHDEQLVVPFVAMPVVCAVHHAKSRQDVADLDDRLVVPRVIGSADQVM